MMQGGLKSVNRLWTLRLGAYQTTSFGDNFGTLVANSQTILLRISRTLTMRIRTSAATSRSKVALLPPFATLVTSIRWSPPEGHRC